MCKIVKNIVDEVPLLLIQFAMRASRRQTIKHPDASRKKLNYIRNSRLFRNLPETLCKNRKLDRKKSSEKIKIGQYFRQPSHVNTLPKMTTTITPHEHKNTFFSCFLHVSWTFKTFPTISEIFIF